ncbi:YciC family protein [Enterobacterales bacterium AW_CKDN230030176-1A_HGKHYDSX7]
MNIVRLCLPLIVLESVVLQLWFLQFEDDVQASQGMIVGMIFYPMYSSALMLYLDARSRGKTPTLRAVFNRMSQFYPKAVGQRLLGALLILVGFMLFIVPGVWLMVRLVFAQYLLVLRGYPVIESMRASVRMTRGHFFRIVFCVLAVMVPIVLLEVGTLVLVPDLSVAGQIVLSSVSAFLQLFSLVVLYRLFMLVEEQQPR